MGWLYAFGALVVGVTVIVWLARKLGAKDDQLSHQADLGKVATKVREEDESIASATDAELRERLRKQRDKGM